MSVYLWKIISKTMLCRISMQIVLEVENEGTNIIGIDRHEYRRKNKAAALKTCLVESPSASLGTSLQSQPSFDRLYPVCRTAEEIFQIARAFPGTQ